MKLSISILLVLTFTAFSLAQTEVEAPAATDIRRVYAGDWAVTGCQSGSDIRVDSFGDETSISFTINWDPLLVQFLEVKNGADLPTGSAITLDKTQIAFGRLGISIVSPTVLPEGRIRIVKLVHVTVREVEAHNPVITFSSSPTPQLTRDIKGNELQTIFVNGRGIYGACDPGTAMSLVERPAASGTAMLDVMIGTAFGQFSGETSFRFSLVWDRSRFTYLSVQPGTGLLPGSTIILDESQIDQGRVGVTINGTGPLPSSLQGFNLAKLQLSRVAGIGNGSYYVHFSDSPVAIDTLDASGLPMFGSALTVGRISVGTGTTLTGTLRRPSGQPLPNTVVVLQGTALTATTSSFGVFTFPSIPHGNGYIIQARSKRYRFASVPIYLNHAANVEMSGLE